MGGVLAQSYFTPFSLRFHIATVVSIILTFFFVQEHPLQHIGLRIGPKALFCSGLFLFFIYFAGHALVLSICDAHGLSCIPRDVGWITPTRPFFQALNDEIVVRALLLGLLVRKMKNGHAASFAGAGLLVAGHYLYYWSNFSVELEPATLVSLMFAMLACNYFFLAAGHIGYSVAFHAGWNLNRFSGLIRDVNGQRINEGMSFNLFEGRPEIVIFSGLICIVACLCYALKVRRLESAGGAVCVAP